MNERRLSESALRNTLGHGALIAGYAVLTLVMFWPLPRGLAEYVPHDLGDPLLSVWTLWWNARVLPFSAEWWNGPVFAPATDTLTLSDHRVGIGLITTPIILAGLSPLTAYNIAFLLSFFLSATAAYLLCFSLTRSKSASFIGGLIFGFNPFRAAHLPHLELLASYCLPLSLLALHRWLLNRRLRWLVALGSALLLQALTGGYYYFFLGVLLLLWAVWFLPRTVGVRDGLRLCVALIVPLAIVAPVLLRYRHAHERMNLSRSIGEIELYSADVIGLLSAPEQLALWYSPAAWQKPEGALLPGLTAVVLVLFGGLYLKRPADPKTSRAWSRFRLACAVVAIGAAMVAAIPQLVGPVAYSLGDVRVSVSAAFKPLSVAVLFFGLWALTSYRVRHAWRTGSAFAFYGLATLAMWLFALGPSARLLGHRVLYKPPYAWLMVLPGFSDGFRVPARFGMLAALTLSVAAAIGFSRVVRDRSVRAQVTAACLVALAIVCESWIAPFPLHEPPKPLTIPESIPENAVVLELPLGIAEDAAAMFRATMHHHPTANGLSGHSPPHYSVLSVALQEDDVEVLDGLAFANDVAVFIAKGPDGAALASLVKERTSLAGSVSTETHDVFVMARPKRETADIPDVPIYAEVAQYSSSVSPQQLDLLGDADLRTYWTAGETQQGGEYVTAALRRASDVTGVAFSLSGRSVGYPRHIAIDTSLDGHTWSQVWDGAGAPRALVAALEDATAVPVVLHFGRHLARYVRIRQTGKSDISWSLAELRVIAHQ